MQTNYKFSYQLGNCEMPEGNTCGHVYTIQKHSQSSLASPHPLQEATLWPRIKASQMQESEGRAALTLFRLKLYNMCSPTGIYVCVRVSRSVLVWVKASR